MSLGDKFDAKKDQTVGGAKEKLGDATDNEQLQAEGSAQEGKGNVKEGIENVKDKAAGVINDVKEKLSGDK